MKNKRPIGYSLFVLLLFAAVGAVEAADSGLRVNEVKFGLLWHDADGLWSGSHKEEGFDYNLEVILSPSLRWMGGMILPALGASINSAADTSKIYVDGRWKYLFSNPGYLMIGLGLALHDGETENRPNSDSKALGASVLFHTVIEYGFNMTLEDSISLFFDHISNAGFNHDNEGLDTLGLRFSHRF